MRRVAPPSGQAGRTRGFTLVEVLLVLALMALVGALLLPVAAGLFSRPGGGNPEDTVAEIFQKVRREAVVTGRPVELRFDSRAQELKWTGGSDRLGGANEKVQCDFLRPSAGSSVLIGGQLVETTTVPLLRFYPDGTCDPVRVQLRIGNARHVIAIDPWTCAPGLEVKS